VPLHIVFFCLGFPCDGCNWWSCGFWRFWFVRLWLMGASLIAICGAPDILILYEYYDICTQIAEQFMISFMPAATLSHDISWEVSNEHFYLKRKWWLNEINDAILTHLTFSLNTCEFHEFMHRFKVMINLQVVFVRNANLSIKNKHRLGEPPM